MSTEVNANVIKRNGVEVIFDKAKIINAVEKANEEVSKLHRLSHYQITALADMIATRALESSHAVNVEDIQDMVETGIMEMRGYEVAQKYVPLSLQERAYPQVQYHRRQHPCSS